MIDPDTYFEDKNMSSKFVSGTMVAKRYYHFFPDTKNLDEYFSSEEKSSTSTRLYGCGRHFDHSYRTSGKDGLNCPIVEVLPTILQIIPIIFRTVVKHLPINLHMNTTEAPRPELQKHKFSLHYITSALRFFFNHLDGEQLPILDETAVSKQNEDRLKDHKYIRTVPIYPPGSISEWDAQKEAASFQHNGKGK